MAGYDFSKGKSNNAIEAEEIKHLTTATKLARYLKVSSKSVTDILHPAEWHHTSLYYNQTNYYEFPTSEEISRIKAHDKELKRIKKYTDCTVKFIEWTGTPKNASANQINLNNCTVAIKGATAYITTIEGKEIRKRTSNNYLQITDCNNRIIIRGDKI